MGKKGNLAVDTRNLCFLCYRPTKIISAGVNSREKDNKVFSLRGVSRYMQVNFRKMMMMQKKDGPPGDQDETTGKFPQVVVTVCSRCSAVTDEFTKLFQYLEFTQMKIDACVRNMNELMKKSDGNSRLVEKFQKKMKTSGKTEWEIVEKIRKELAEKCSSNLKKVLPRVTTEKLRNDPPPPPPLVLAIAKGKAKITTTPSKPGPRSRKPGLSVMKKVKSTLPKDNTKTSFIGKSIFTSVSTPEKLEPGERFQCLHCDKTFNDTSGLRVHIVMDHREQFFSMLKNPDLSEEDFKIAVERLFQDVRKITAHCGNQSESSVSYICTCCGKPFDVIIDTYVHMVQLHHDVLSSRLQTIQKDLASSKKTAKPKPSAPDSSSTRVSKRKKRGPYKKNVMDKSASTSDSTTEIPDIASTSTNSAKKKTPTIIKTAAVASKKTKSKNKPQYPRVCKCGVTLSSSGNWNRHHQLFRCKLKTNPSSKLKNKAVSSKHPVLKRAKNAMGFPRTCECGVRLTLRSSWSNHVKRHCKLKVNSTNALQTPAPTPQAQVSRAEKRKLLFEAAANKSIRTALTRSKRLERGTGNALENKVKPKKKVKKYQRVCKCGSVLKSEKSWYAHQRNSCKLKENDISMTSEAMDALNACVEIEEVPVDITPAGELCLTNVITTVDDSSYPKIVSTSSSSGGGGVIKGLHKIANFQASFRKEKEDETIKIIESSSFSELFSPYLPIKTLMGEIDAALGKVLQNYRKFPGNISGCPFCGRGFTQITELQNHMVEGHFEEVLSQVKRLIDPSNLGENNYSFTIDLHPGYSVKREKGMEADLSSNDVNVTGSEESNDYQSYMEVGAEEHEVTPKEEIARLSANENDQSMDLVNDDYNQFMILP